MRSREILIIFIFLTLLKLATCDFKHRPKYPNMKWVKEEQEVTVFKFGKGLVKETRTVDVQVEDRDEKFAWMYEFIDKHLDENGDFGINREEYMNLLDDYVLN